MKQQDTIAGRIVKNVNRVLEVIPRTINSEAEVIRLNFQKPRKASAKSRTQSRSGVKVKTRAKKLVRKAKRLSTAAKRKVSASLARRKKTVRGKKKSKSANKSLLRPVSRAA